MATRQQLQNRWKRPPWSERNQLIVRWCTNDDPTGTRFWDLRELYAFLDGLPFREEVSSGWDLRASAFRGACNVELTGFDLTYSLDRRSAIGLTRCRATDCVFDESGVWDELSGDYTRCSFRGAHLAEAWMTHGSFRDCNFDGAHMNKAKAYRIDLRGSSFRGARMRGASLSQSDLRGCDFTDADLTGAGLLGVTVDQTTSFRGARLIGAMLVDNHSPEGHRLPPLDLSLAQTDARTQVGDDPAELWKLYLTVIAHHLEAHKAKRWAPAVREIVERTRKSLKKTPPEAQHQWAIELKERIGPADWPEVEEMIAEATRTMV